MEKPGFETFAAIRKYTLKLVKVLQNQKRREKSGLNLVDAYGGDSGEGDQQDEHGDDDEVDIEDGLAAIYALGLAPE